MRIAAALLATTILAFSAAAADTRKPSDFETFSNYLSARHAASDFDLTEAYKYYKLSLADDPNNVDLLSRAFVYAASSGDIEDGAKLAKQVIAATPDNKLAQLVLIVDAIKRGRYSDVSTYTKRTDGSVSAGPTILLLSAWTAAGQKDFDGALALIDLLKKGGNADAVADYHRALILDLAGRDADGAYKQALLDVGPAPRITEAYGRYLERMGRTADANTFYSKLSDQTALQPVTTAGLARLSSGKKPDALVSDAKLGAAEAMFAIGSSLTDNSTADLAILYLQCALYLRPDLDLSRVLLADRFETLKKYSDALAIYQQIGKSSPYYRVAAVQAAVNMARLKRNDDAVAALKPLAAANPNDQEIWTALGDVYRAMDKYAEAADAYSQAIKTVGTPAQKDWPLFYARAVAEQQSDQWPQAEADLQTALKLSPEEPDVLNNLGYSWVEKQKNIPQALVMLEKARSLRPFDGYIVDSVGWAYYRLGKYDDAAKTLLNAVLLVPGDPTINEHLGDAYWRVGKKLDAHFQWSHALTFTTDDKNKPELQEKLQTGLPGGYREQLMFAPAKINLFLHIGDKRADGFHALESLVVFADVGDDVSFEKADALSLAVSGPFADELGVAGNLVLQAAETFAERTGQAVNTRITLTKNLPVASGIGGGSADAAAALRELAVIYPGAGEATLMEIAEELGSDVPACVRSHALVMRGRGEILDAAPVLPELHALLVNPRVAVPTGEVFAGLKQRTGVGAVKMPDDLSRGLIRFLLGTRNDLEAPARAIAPVIGDALDEISRMPGILLARMSGSGATCFGLFESSFEAELAATAVSHSHPEWWVKAAALG